MQKPNGFYATSIELAFKNKDAKTVIHAYLDILDYQSAGLTAEHLSMVFESLNYESAIDHALVEHLGKIATVLKSAHDATLKLHQALYFYKSKGYLTAVDILKEVAASSNSSKIGNSEQLKNQLFTPIFDAANEIDADIKGQLVEAIKSIPLNKWEDRTFFGIEEHLASPQAAAEEPQVAVNEEKAAPE
jgi:hypothetical protein